MDYKQKAISYAEQLGIYEFKVNENYLEYWSLYIDGFHFSRVNLDTFINVEVCVLPWKQEDNIPVPAFLKNEHGATLYNYMIG